jgi:hypothetical protein
MDPVTESLISTWGPAGAIIIAEAAAIIWLAKSLIAAHKSRVQDAQVAAGALIELMKQSNAASSELTHAVERLTEVVERADRQPPHRGGTYRG